MTPPMIFLLDVLSPLPLLPLPFCSDGEIVDVAEPTVVATVLLPVDTDETTLPSVV